MGAPSPQPVRALPPRSAVELRLGVPRTAATTSAAGARRNAAASPRPPPGERREPGPVAERPPGSRRAPHPVRHSRLRSGTGGQGRSGGVAGGTRPRQAGGQSPAPSSEPPRPARRPPASSGAGGAILAVLLLPGEWRRGRPLELHVARRERHHRSRDAERPLPPAAPEALPAGGTGWRRAAPGVTASGGRRRAVLTRRRERSGAVPARPGAAAPWWPSSASAWPTRSTARTSRSAGTSPRPRGRPRRRKRRSGPGCWRCSSSWSADQPSSRSSRASAWACEPPPRRAFQALRRHSERPSPCHSALSSTTCTQQ